MRIANYGIAGNQFKYPLGNEFVKMRLILILPKCY